MKEQPHSPTEQTPSPSPVSEESDPTSAAPPAAPDSPPPPKSSLSGDQIVPRRRKSVRAAPHRVKEQSSEPEVRVYFSDVRLQILYSTCARIQYAMSQESDVAAAAGRVRDGSTG